MSTTTAPGLSAGAAPWRPNSTSATIGPFSSIVTTMSASRTASAAVSATVAPWAASASALARERFQATSG